MKTVESLVEELTDIQLKEAFDEITEWRKEGVLKMDGIIRSVHREFEEVNQTNLMIHVMDTPFLYEIAKRSYRKI